MQDLWPRIALFTNHYQTIRSLLCTCQAMKLPANFWLEFFTQNHCQKILEEDIVECADFLWPALEKMTDWNWINTLSDQHNLNQQKQKRLCKEARQSRLLMRGCGLIGEKGAIGCTGSTGIVGAAKNIPVKTPQMYLVEAIMRTACRRILNYFLNKEILEGALLDKLFNREKCNEDFRAYYRTHKLRNKQ